MHHLRPGIYQFALGKPDRTSPAGYRLIALAKVTVESGKTAEVALTPK